MADNNYKVGIDLEVQNLMDESQIKSKLESAGLTASQALEQGLQKGSQSFLKTAQIIGQEAKDRMKIDAQISLIQLQRDREKFLNEMKMFKKQGEKELELQAKVNLQNIDKEIKKTSDQIKTLGKDTEQGTSKMSQSFLSFANIIKTAVAGSILSLTKEVIFLADGYEKAEMGFATILGSAEKAKALLQELSDFAKKTPFEITGVRETAKQLLAMGTAQKDIIPTLKFLGDVSSALNVPLERLALNYGQVITQGKLTGRELKDFALAGVPLLDELSTMLGKSKAEIQKMVSEGKIGSEVVTQAFERMTSEGGRFANMMAQQSQTLSGMRSNFKDTLTVLGEKIGMEILPGLKIMADSLNGLFEGGPTNVMQERLVELEGEMKDVQWVSDELDRKIDDLTQRFKEGKISVSEYTRELYNLKAQKDLNSEAMDELSLKTEKQKYLNDELSSSTQKLEQGVLNLIEANKRGEITQSEMESGIKKLNNAFTVQEFVIGNLSKSTGDLEEAKKTLFAMQYDNSGEINQMNNEQLQARNTMMSYMNLLRVKSLALGGLKRASSGNWFTPDKLLEKKRQSEAEERSKVEADLKEIKGIIESNSFSTSALAGVTEEAKALNKELGGGGGGGNKAKKQQEELLKQAEETAKRRIALVNASGKSEINKAIEIININKQLEEEKKKIKGEDIALEKQSAEEVVKIAKDQAKSISDIAKKLMDEAGKKTEDYAKKISDVYQKLGEVQKKRNDIRGEQNVAVRDLDAELGEMQNDLQSSLADRYVELSTADKVSSTDADEMYQIQQKIGRELIRQAEARERMTESEKNILDFEKKEKELLEKRDIASAVSNREDMSEVIIKEADALGNVLTYYKNEKDELVQIQNLKNIQYAENLMRKQEELLANKEMLENDLAVLEEGMARETLLKEKYTSIQEAIDKDYTKKFKESLKQQEQATVDSLNVMINKYRELNAVRGGGTGTAPVARAWGGPLSAGQLALVGEHGPEQIVARASAMVQPGNAVNHYNNQDHSQTSSFSLNVGGINLGNFGSMEDLLNGLRPFITPQR